MYVITTRSDKQQLQRVADTSDFACKFTSHNNVNNNTNNPTTIQAW